MGQIIFTILFIIASSAFLIFSVRQESFFIEPSTQNASALEGINTVYANFDETGTLVFYPNNVGPVPYLFYQNQSGRTIAKALTFSDFPPADFSSWTGARVSVTGRLVSEHVAVSRIIYLSAP